MNVDDLVKTVLRRKWATLAVLVLAVLAGYVGYSSAQTTFESRAALLIYPPGAGDVDAGLNPFTRLDNGIAQLGVVATTIMQGDVAAEAFAATGATSYTVDNVAGNSASVAQLTPRLAITVTAPTAESAQAGAQSLIDVVGRELDTVQRNAGQRNGTLAQTTVLNPPLPGVAAGSNAPRAAGAYAAAILIPGLLLILGVSSYFDRRRPDAGSTRVKPRRAATAASQKDLRRPVKQISEPEPATAADPGKNSLAAGAGGGESTQPETRGMRDEPVSHQPEHPARAGSAVDADRRYRTEGSYDDGRQLERDHRSWDEVRPTLVSDTIDASTGAGSLAPDVDRGGRDVDREGEFVAHEQSEYRAEPFYSADVATERLEIGTSDRLMEGDPVDDDSFERDTENQVDHAPAAPTAAAIAQSDDIAGTPAESDDRKPGAEASSEDGGGVEVEVNDGNAEGIDDVDRTTTTAEDDATPLDSEPAGAPPEEGTPGDDTSERSGPVDKAPIKQRDRKSTGRKAGPMVDDYYGVDDQFDNVESRDANSVR